MNIIVCIKQVPGTTKVDIDEETGVLKRDGVEAKINPYDLYAIETAMRLTEEYGGKASAVTMGPMQAASAIKEAVTMGVSGGAILSDRAFAGADVLATSYALSQGIRKLGEFDLIVCGKQTTDGDTAQVGPEIAEYLNIPHISNVVSILDAGERSVTLEADLGDFVQTLEVSFPCLITVEKDLYTPRLPSYNRMTEAYGQEITVLSLAELDDNNPQNYGLKGSPTQVERIFTPEPSTEKIKVTGSGDEIAEVLYNTLQRHKFTVKA